ncbi:flippase-like domain-containing protein [Candidatus Peregrinibacteria bacterium]|jgi:glycosyltransferase 2 family protein|nr:flippase-like domain-containing protein [Candidatus Peregrinibacteria bacterium]MBT5468061.1 flippase-like domain-containing protein [Candidatus Peregrinibacteria bacterium]MBT7337585.1 flippase-like domain-containing protein [Candidatus Peregrinibacteria bacterium]
MAKRWILRLLKLIGIGIFILILSQIDREELFLQLQSVNIIMLGLSFPLLFCIYFCKTQRFKALVHTTDISLSLQEHWKIFNIGVFLAGITPAKLGELGRAAYLKNVGIHTAKALSIAIVDRLFDVACIGIIGIISAGVLFGWKFLVTLLVLAIIGAQIGRIFWKKMTRLHWIEKAIVPGMTWTLVSWSIYFLWALLIAWSIDISVSVPILISTFTVTGIISLLPIAPSGLGTRDAALLILLAPYGVSAEQAVSLAFLMFISIIFSGLLGGWYWVKGVR